MKGSFEQGILAFQKKLETELTAKIVKVIFDVHKDIIMRSPVDTGRYRASNQISLNSLPESSVLVFHKDGSIARGKEKRDGKIFRPIKEDIDVGGRVTIENGKQVIDSYSLGDTVFLYNNVSYAIFIEEGNGKVPPRPVYRIAAARMIERLQQITIEGV